ncbi:MAG: AsmA family protein, partial [Desulfovibrio sp.]|nr:AsmA family protein [Desulfovibrio sp.]
MSPAGAFRFLRVLSGRLLRWVLLPAAGLVLLAVVAFFLFCAFKSEMLAAALEEHLRLETGLPWKIAGPIRPVFSPLPGIRVDDVRILAASLEQEQPALFRPPLLAVRRLQIVPNLPDL